MEIKLNRCRFLKAFWKVKIFKTDKLIFRQIPVYLKDKEKTKPSAQEMKNHLSTCSWIYFSKFLKPGSGLKNQILQRSVLTLNVSMNCSMK